MKVFLVEDEVVIRNGIKNCIDWEKEGFEFVGEASDGELAYPQILKTKPDVLITDIKMPFMDGIELSKLVKEKFPDIRIVIVSGYDEFEYAREAILLGATDYLLKPVSAEKLVETLAKIKETEEKKNQEKDLMEKYMYEMRENVQFEKQKFFNRLVSEQMSMSEVLDIADNLKIDISAQVYNFLLLKIIDDEDNLEEINDVYKVIEEYFIRRRDVILFNRGVEGWGIIIMGDSDERIKQIIGESNKYIENEMKKYNNVKYFGAVGMSVYRIGELKKSFHSANIIFANRFIGPYNKILFNIETQKKEDTSLIEAKDINTIEENKDLLIKFLKNGTAEEVENFVNVYFDEFPSDNLKSLIMRQYIAIDSYVNAISFVKGLNIDTSNLEIELEDMRKLFEQETSLEKLKEYLSKLINKIIDLRYSVSGNKNSEIVNIAKEYINNNYMEDDISLNTIASYVNMSPSYFSALFRKETDQTVVEYLTHVRMEKAKELLMCSSKKASDIGYEVGYKDAHYFSYIFKKIQKCTPREYRLRGRQEENVKEEKDITE